MNTCRICRSTDCEDIINLGNQVITSRFPKLGDYSTPSTPICLIQCNNCKLVQLKQYLDGSDLYEHEYGYRSGINNTMREHLKNYNKYVQTYINLEDGDTVLDIGSNDATFLKNYDSKIKSIHFNKTLSETFRHGDFVLFISRFYHYFLLRHRYQSR
jgi:hypothetical protein